ncbi:MAG: nucleoside triphosphate pyrophosphohydrolase [Methylobacteriaceae bacterium]|nr:nucleoside triphosphate pyrophosphohydrolase [Methylobacteriaceae bacterium]MBV9635929.1 nucleoside triphosphate pyrophosphohydrolase [Methylobacteriaceae bacterium]
MTPARDLSRLLEIMAALRHPQTGCPWDIEQTFASIAPYTIEEAYEVADAIGRGDLVDLKEELGDLLLQVVFHARLAQELGAFDFGDVVEAITSKLVRRHPHVFGDARALSADAVRALWGKIKADEGTERRRHRQMQDPVQSSALAGIPAALPALSRAAKLQSKAASVGFDWHDVRPVLAKINEEIGEVTHALDSRDSSAVRDEIGDLLFAVANLARHAHVDPEDALRCANAKFEHRFRYIEAALERRGKSPQESTLEEMDALWDEAKRAARVSSDPPADALAGRPAHGDGAGKPPVETIEAIWGNADG